MNLVDLIGIVAGSALTGSLVTYIANRGKVKAETNNIIGQTYGDLIEELRGQIKHQGQQINAMQEREVEYLKIIHQHQETERELRLQIKALETKLAKRITKIESNLP